MGEIKCKYVEGAKRKNSKNNGAEEEENKIDSPPVANGKINTLQPPGNISPQDAQTTVLPDLTPTSNLNVTSYEMASIKLWPVINARFIRIRPWKWKKYIALRMELLGNDRPMDHQQIGKVVHLNTVSPLYKEEILSLLKDKDSSTPFIQIDCKTTIQKAMDLAGCTTYGMVETDKKHTLLMFTTPDSRTSERVMDCLTEVGVGIHIGTISAVSVEWRNSAKKLEQNTPSSSPANATKSSGFYSNIKSHKAVQVVVERIMNASQISFDNLCMLIIAAIIAVAGLGTDSSVIVIASMLVSPLMGPVLALTFGYTISEKTMFRMGLVNELYMLMICILIGFVVGFFWSLIFSNHYQWPTNEMTDRGQPIALATGILIAAASGVGVALSVLADYLTTVVGVAISASLLPPAVNCGMLFAFALYELTPSGLRASSHEYTKGELFGMAGISLALTVENIIVIFLSAAAMFRIKDIVQIHDRNQERVWDNISHFRRQHRKLKKAQSIEDEVHNGYSYTSHLDAFNFDVNAPEGTDAAKAIAQIENTMTHEDMMKVFHGTHSAKVGVLKQAKTIYNLTHDDIKDDEERRQIEKEKNNKKNDHFGTKKRSSGNVLIKTGRNKDGYYNIRLDEDNESSSPSDDEIGITNGHSHPAVSTLFPAKSGMSQKIEISDHENERSQDNIVSSNIVDEND